MRKFFKGTPEKAADGWMLAFVSGTSMTDDKTWIIDTNSLHADQVPSGCNDAADFSKLVAGLLNCYFNNVDTRNFAVADLIDAGTVTPDEEIPSAKNPTLF